MAKYVYPAIFSKEEGGYSVAFPDLDGCYTAGEDLLEAIDMAEDALALMLYHLEKEKRRIPRASEAEQIRVKKGEFVNYITCDTLGYQKRKNKKAVKKTLSIPGWMDEAATDAGINFSQLLQEALSEKLEELSVAEQKARYGSED